MRFFQSLFIAIVASALSATASMGAETSRANVLGFNEDGRYFVFEEYGIADGIGVPYVNLFAIDTSNDQWVKGSPARIEPREEDMDETADELGMQILLQEARDRARAKADPFLLNIGRLGFGAPRAANLPWELSAEPHFVRFTHHDLRPSGGRAYRLTLEEQEYEADDKCYGFSQKMYGFRLRLTEEFSGDYRILHEDKRIPKSRPCPLSYRIEQVWTHTPASGKTVFAVLVRYMTIGFEGQDGRLIAVTGHIRP